MGEIDADQVIEVLKSFESSKISGDEIQFRKDGKSIYINKKLELIARDGQFFLYFNSNWYKISRKDYKKFLELAKSKQEPEQTKHQKLMSDLLRVISEGEVS